MSKKAEAPPDEEPLPPRPEAGDCCNGGCAVCVLEGYQEEVEAWERQVAEILERRKRGAFPSGT